MIQTKWSPLTWCWGCTGVTAGWMSPSLPMIVLAMSWGLGSRWKDLWFPDIYIDKVQDIRKPIFSNPSSYLRIFPDNRLLYSFRTNYDIGCPMDFTRYPVDVQECSIRFESYGSSATILDLDWYQTVYRKDIILNQHDFEIRFTKEKAVTQAGMLPRQCC